ncbi:MAG TPA: methyltransferase domain-containing protein, partial [Chloroflexota bacterium]|nr:methyltransferase domain-containing protein [Chloroflexota bacterium]
DRPQDSGDRPQSGADRAQNIYDDPQFFAGYSGLERFGPGWERAVEQPDFLRLLPDVAGSRVLDLGCGTGHLAFHLAEAGAAEVVALDVSERMLSLAQAERAHPRVTYRLESMEGAVFPAERFELVVSSLAFHYVHDYHELVGRIARWLVPGGVLVFSTEHPIFTARALTDGWVVDESGARLAWALDRYAEEGPRLRHWFVPGVVRYHRTVATLLNGLLDAGLALERVVEPVPGEAWLRDRPQDVDERRRPIFILFRARKP